MLTHPFARPFGWPMRSEPFPSGALTKHAARCRISYPYDCVVDICACPESRRESALAQKAEESKSDNIGPWKIEATFKADKFDRCAISRKTDDVVARFIRTSDGLSVVLESANWKLERGKQYSVRMKAASSSWDTEVAAEANSVSVPLLIKSLGRVCELPTHSASRAQVRRFGYPSTRAVPH
jgi:hypothetical protein